MNSPAEHNPDDLVAERFATLVRNVPELYALVTFVTCCFAYALIGSVPAPILASWTVVMVGPSIGRGLHWYRLKTHGYTLTIAQMRRELKRTTWLGFVFGIIFCGIGFVVSLTAGTGVAVMTLLVVWGAAVGSAFYLVVLQPAAMAILACSVLTVGGVFATSGNMDLIATLPPFFGITLALASQIRRSFANFKDLVQSRALIEAMRRKAEGQALTDALTGLPNRRHFDECLRDRVTAGQPFAVVMLDLDGFKPVNDVHGHAVGDEVLKEVARRLKSSLPAGTAVARMGGDEFAILMAKSSARGLSTEDVVQGAVRSLEAPHEIGDLRATVGASCGIAYWNAPGDEARLVEKADLALYKSKAQARHEVVVFSGSMDHDAQRAAAVEQALRLAVANGTMEVAYQPVFDLASGVISGFEALARLTHAELGSIPPGEFIPLAERTGLIHQMSDQLLRKAARFAATWPRHLALSFNVSAAQIVQPSAGLRIIQCLTESGFDCHRFEAEVTETAIMSDTKAASRIMAGLRAAGVRFALDDFGSGYSSFSHLCELPLDRIKIDRRFAARLCTDQRTASVVGAIIRMGQSLNLKCVAEGIETEEQLARFKELECGFGQGFRLRRPMSQHDLELFMAGDGAKLVSAA